MKAVRSALTIIAIAGVFAIAEVPAQPAHAQKDEPKIFRVYFQSGQTEISPDAETVVSDAVDYAKTSRATYVEVIGHADTHERNPLALSFVRAREVRKSLRQHGLPDSINVTVDAAGESDLAVPIPPETSNPLDRYADVKVH